jgi:hypothetical protein
MGAEGARDAAGELRRHLYSWEMIYQGSWRRAGCVDLFQRACGKEMEAMGEEGVGRKGGRERG